MQNAGFCRRTYRVREYDAQSAAWSGVREEVVYKLIRNATEFTAEHIDASRQFADEFPGLACTDCVGTFERATWNKDIFPGWRSNTYKYVRAKAVGANTTTYYSAGGGSRRQLLPSPSDEAGGSAAAIPIEFDLPPGVYPEMTSARRRTGASALRRLLQTRRPRSNAKRLG